MATNSREQQHLTLALEKMSDDLTAAGVKTYPSPGRLRVALPGLELAVFALDRVPPAERERRVYGALQVRVRAGQVEDPVFGWLDVNHDGRLTPRELEGASKRLVELDREGDGLVTAAQLPEQVTCAIVRGGAANDAMDATGLSGKPPGDLPRWLKAIDTDGDGEISPREFLGTSAQFSELDVNGDGFLDSSEVRPNADPSP
jgi:hypothetical protein